MSTTIATVIFLKDNEWYLQFLLPILAQIEVDYPDIHLTYYIYENDSSDQTPVLLKEFMAGRQGKLMTETGAPTAPEAASARGTTQERIRNFVSFRNAFLDKIREDVCEADWVWFIDSNIFFDKTIITDMLEAAGDVYSERIGMLTCRTTETVLIEKYLALGGDPSKIPEGCEFGLSVNHYYDTYAYIDKDSRSFYPKCNFADCANCAEAEAEGAGGAKATDAAIMDVNSAWGGCVLIKGEIIKSPAVRWDTVIMPNGNALCEHVLFCDRIRSSSGQRIVVLNNIQPFWIA